MKKYWIFLVVIIMGLGVGAIFMRCFMTQKCPYSPPTSSGVQNPEIGNPTAGEFMPGEVLVKFKPGTPKRVILALKEKLKITEEMYTESLSLYHWKGSFDTEKTIEFLQKSPDVLYAEPNYKVQIQKK